MNGPARKAVLLSLRPFQQKTMPQFLVVGCLPDDLDPSQMDEAAGRKIHAFCKPIISQARAPAVHVFSRWPSLAPLWSGTPHA